MALSLMSHDPSSFHPCSSCQTDCRVNLAPRFPVSPSAARAAEEGTSVFYDGYAHHFYPGPLLGSGRKGKLLGGKCTQARPVAASSLISIKSPLRHAHHDCLAAKSRPAPPPPPPRHGGYTNGEEQHRPQFEQEQLWLLNSELRAQPQSI